MIRTEGKSYFLKRSAIYTPMKVITSQNAILLFCIYSMATRDLSTCKCFIETKCDLKFIYVFTPNNYLFTVVFQLFYQQWQNKIYTNIEVSNTKKFNDIFWRKKYMFCSKKENSGKCMWSWCVLPKFLSSQAAPSFCDRVGILEAFELNV